MKDRKLLIFSPCQNENEKKEEEQKIENKEITEEIEKKMKEIARAITEEQGLADIPRFLLCFGPVPRLSNATCRKLWNLETVGIIPFLL